MNAERRHSRPEPVHPSSTQPANGGKGRTGGLKVQRPVMNQFGDRNFNRKKMGDGTGKTLKEG